LRVPGGRRADHPRARRYEAEIQQATDIGALGIVVPTVDDAIEARTRAGRQVPAVRAAQRRAPGRLAHLGRRRHQLPADDHDNMLVIVMIETPQGVDNAYEIAAQPGVDVVSSGTPTWRASPATPATTRAIRT